jgi:hypothetical protein
MTSRIPARRVRFFLIAALLALSAPHSPAPVSERIPVFKRTFFTLKGHAVDTFTNEQKLPPELSPAFTRASVLATKPFATLTDLMKKFGRVVSFPPELLKAAPEGEEPTAEMELREAAIQKIAKSQLKKIATTPTLSPAAGAGSEIKFSASELPSAFFADAVWSIESSQPEELLTKSKRPGRARIEIPMAGLNLRLSRFAAKNDIGMMRRASVEAKIKDSRASTLMRFYADACRGGIPQRLLPLEVTFDECGGSTTVTATAPPLQVRVVVLENTAAEAIELGQFHFRLLDPGPGILAVRSRAENETLLASMTAESEAWFKPRLLKPGERIIVPLEMLFKPNRPTRFSDSEEDPAATRARRRAAANKLLGDRELETVAIMYEGKAGNAETPQMKVPLVVMPKQKFVDAWLREPIPPSEKEEFVYGPSIALDSVEVNGLRSEIDPFDPINIAYYSGYEGGSCPFVYTRRAPDGTWLKQGTILTGCSAKAREGTRKLRLGTFDGTLRIAEEEDESSYIDELLVRGTLVNGEKVTLRPADDRISQKDRRYLALKKGDSIEIKFAIPNGMQGPVEIVSSGFFELSSRPPAQ